MNTSVYIDEVGKKYGQLLVTARHKNKDSGSATCLCLCDCGIIVPVAGYALRYGHIKSCGCLRKNGNLGAPRKGLGEASKNTTYRNMQRKAKHKKRTWAIDFDQFCTFTQLPCYYCGSSPENITRNGLDRVNNAEGYTLENIVPCCKKCNFAKRTMDVLEFKTWIKTAHDHLFKLQVSHTRFAGVPLQ